MAGTTGARVLVLEDEWMIAEQLVTALTLGGYEVVGPFARVDEALSLLARAPVAAAVLDINLQGERSFIVSERLGEASIPFVFVSGYSGAVLPDRYKDQPLMTKPIDDERLLSCLRSLLAPAPAAEDGSVHKRE